MSPQSPMSFLAEELQALKENWYWFLILGVVLIVLGLFAIGSPFVAGVAVVTVLGCLLILGGGLEIIAAFWTRGWGAFFLNLLLGIFYVILGMFMLEQTEETLLVVTLVIAVGLLIEGVFRIVASMANQFPGWGWVLFGGIIDLLLGVMIWRQWPVSGLWVVGLFLGISLLFNGSTWVALALSIREIQARTPAEGAADSPAEAT